MILMLASSKELTNMVGSLLRVGFDYISLACDFSLHHLKLMGLSRSIGVMSMLVDAMRTLLLLPECYASVLVLSQIDVVQSKLINYLYLYSCHLDLSM